MFQESEMDDDDTGFDNDVDMDDVSASDVDSNGRFCMIHL
jgi:hypothetical protein